MEFTRRPPVQKRGSLSDFGSLSDDFVPDVDEEHGAVGSLSECPNPHVGSLSGEDAAKTANPNGSVGTNSAKAANFSHRGDGGHLSDDDADAGGEVRI